MKGTLFIKIINVLTIVAGIVFALINILHYAGEPTLGADIVSRVLPAEAYRIGLGIPYKDFWEITPPGHYIVLDTWSQFFGFSALSIKMLHIFVSVLIVFLVFYVLRRILGGLYANVSAGIIYFLLFSTRLTTFILPAEILALVFSVAGLASLFYFKNYKKALFIAGFLFFFSGQVKDPFIFSGLAMLPYVLFLLLRSKKDFYKGLIFSAAGVMISAGVTVLYLLIMGSAKDYLTILNYKSVAFGVFDITWLSENFLVHINFAKDVFFYFGYSIVLLVISFLAVKIYLKIKNKSVTFKTQKNGQQKYLQAFVTWKFEDHILWTTIFYILGLSIGFVAQHSLGSHYYLVVVVPMVTLISMFFYSIDKELAKSKKGNWLRILVFICFLAVLFPKKAYFVDYNFGKTLDIRFIPKLAIWANNNPGTFMQSKIDSRTSKADCILDIYGWGVGTTYLYAERRPCTRFFIANLVVEDWQRIEYKSDIISGGPRALIYNPTAGDIDYKAFEGRVINFPKIIKQCYLPDGEYKTLYWPKYEGGTLRECIGKNAGA